MPPASPINRRAQLVALQGLRGFAALLVVVDHALLTLAAKVGQPIDEAFAGFLGNFGVYLFFVISGFVMIVSHGDDFARGRSGSFIVRRLGRIVPLYYLCMAIYAVKLSLQGEPPGGLALLLSALFVPHQDASSVYGQPVYPLGWTLQYEMVFYAVFAFALMLPLRRGLALLVTVFAAWVGASAAGLLAWSRPLAYLGEPLVLYFLAGVGLGLLRRRWQARPAGLARAPDFATAMLSALAISALGIAAHIATGAYGLPVIVCVVAACACTMLADERQHAGWAAGLARELGNATYSIYLTHSFVLGPAGRAAGRWWPQVPAWLFCAVTVIVACVVGMLAHRVVERPILKAWARLTTGSGSGSATRDSRARAEIRRL